MSALPAWQQAPYLRAESALRGERLAHALLLVGATGLGKRAVAAALAARLLCQAPVDHHACGRCRGCTLRQAGTHPDLRRIGLELRDDGKPRTEIVIDQIRVLAEALSMTPQFGGASVVVLDPADAMNTSAANALLKTLEEPQPGRYLLLVSDRPAQLPATIRSRCQRLEFAAPPRDQALATMIAAGANSDAAADALAMADGNPGMAAELLAEDAPALRDSVQADLAAIASGREAPFDVARRWLQDAPDRRLFLALEAVRRTGWRASGAAAERSAGLTAAGDFSKLAAWFDAALRTREQLRGPVRPELALGDLLCAWRDAAG